MAGPGPEAWRRGRDRAQAVGPAGLALPPSSAPRSPAVEGCSPRVPPRLSSSTQGGRSHGPPGPAVGARRVSEVPEQDRGRPAPGPRPPRPPAPRHQSPGSLAPCMASGKLLSIHGFSLWKDENSGCFPKRPGNPLALGTMPEQSVRWPSATGSAVPPAGWRGTTTPAGRG